MMLLIMAMMVIMTVIMTIMMIIIMIILAIVMHGHDSDDGAREELQRTVTVHSC